jgi:pseudouridine-5'-phosphate glycosidase
MNPSTLLDIRPEVAAALREGRPVVALGSAPIAHSLPWPINLEMAREAEMAVRAEGAIPAVIAVWEGRPTIGLGAEEVEALARGKSAYKASHRDLATAVVHGRTAATTIAANMALAHLVGIRLLATGGMGNVGRSAEQGLEIPDDLVELSRTPVAVVSSGPKGILNLPRTVEILETYGVTAVGYGTNSMPAFYVGRTSHPVSARVNTPAEAARFLTAHWAMGGAGILLTQPAPAAVALDPEEYAHNLIEVERQAGRGISSKDLTPFLTSRLARLTGGKTLQAYKAILAANASLAARIGHALAAVTSPGPV